jgi:hypothetical protein
MEDRKSRATHEPSSVEPDFAELHAEEEGEVDGDRVVTVDVDVSDTRAFDESIETAFQLATLRGPLCAEPMMGMAFHVEKIEVQSDEASKESCKLLLPSRNKRREGWLILRLRCENSADAIFTDYWDINIFDARGDQERAARLVASNIAGDVFVRYTGFE